MRRLWILALAAVCMLGISSVLLAGNGKGPGDGTGTGRCECGAYLDVDPVDGFCDICGGCIPDGDGNGPNGKGPGDGTGTGPCECDECRDGGDDGLCDNCGGCIPDGDGPQ
ncbi:MAG: hypothetical protein HQ581_06975 [Planctomycetes bacterium]|nr:hypothetical protein [Planctomycetota bacterium]